jgi:glycosyltransferase involved in cell wall biosynthesis
MRLAYVCADPGVPVFGHKGCSIHVQEVIRALRQHGVAVELFATNLHGERPADLADLIVHALPVLPKGDPAIREQAAIAANISLFRALNHAGPFDALYERYSLWSYAGMRYAQSFRIPGLLEVNAPLIVEQSTHRTLVHQQVAETIASRVFGAASTLFAVSEAVEAYLQPFCASHQSICVLPNGVDPQRFQPAAPPRPERPFTIGFVGSLKPWHGLPTLITAFDLLYRRMPEARLMIIGDGPERPILEANVEGRELQDSVIFTGSVPPGQIPQMLHQLDVAVAPYAHGDQAYFSPLKVFEYMACGLPVVAGAVGQLKTIIQHQQNGLLYPPGDAAMLSEWLWRLANQPSLVAQLGAQARATILAKHTWESVTATIVRHAKANRPVPQSNFWSVLDPVGLLP